jgi:hypothetical protein
MQLLDLQNGRQRRSVLIFHAVATVGQHADLSLQLGEANFKPLIDLTGIRRGDEMAHEEAEHAQEQRQE